MPLSIEKVASLLDKSAMSVLEILSLRQSLQAPFRFHPLGFIACTLMAAGSVRLRLHYWPVLGGYQQSRDCQIHDHLFEFKSWVLSGSVENTEYAISLEGREFAVYCTEYDGDQSVLTKTNQTRRITEHRRSAYAAGDTYEVATEVLHETRRVGETSAFTVLLTKDISAASSLVLGSISSEQRYVYRREMIPEVVVERMLAAALTSR